MWHAVDEAFTSHPVPSPDQPRHVVFPPPLFNIPPRHLMIRPSRVDVPPCHLEFPLRKLEFPLPRLDIPARNLIVHHRNGVFLSPIWRLLFIRNVHQPMRCAARCVNAVCGNAACAVPSQPSNLLAMIDTVLCACFNWCTVIVVIHETRSDEQDAAGHAMQLMCEVIDATFEMRIECSQPGPPEYLRHVLLPYGDLPQSFIDGCTNCRGEIQRPCRGISDHWQGEAAVGAVGSGDPLMHFVGYPFGFVAKQEVIAAFKCCFPVRLRAARRIQPHPFR